VGLCGHRGLVRRRDHGAGTDERRLEEMAAVPGGALFFHEIVRRAG